ncbi:MAG: HU family DNA-binding protein [Magnetococcales bacterium]|nr:HU family DNA-binding protein [Magnetococcales bacterium]
MIDMLFVLFNLRGFGSFGLKERQPRTGRNPKSGETVPVEAKRVMFFKAGLEMRRRVDNGGQS